uniref:Uncharacterized protein n=1 Tax=Acrobeloides nanus TaxID=290746 RepID=A0A914C1C8_9BILA
MGTDQPEYNYTVSSYENMPVDHFSYTNGDVFNLKFVYNLDYYEDGGPIFFYTGNQERIEVFINNTGIIWDIAPLFKAAVVFAEHRYYGDTKPYGNHSYDDASTLGYLSTSQVLADYATLIPWFKRNFSIPENAPVIAFGGSYGSMLATWFRLKYPHIVSGTYASSPPLLFVKPGAIDIGAFDRWTTNTFLQSGCDKTAVINAFNALKDMGANQEGLNSLNTIFQLQSTSYLTSADDVSNYLEPYIRNAFEQLAAADYPYNTSFYDVLPGWSVNISCEYLKVDASDNKLRATNLFKAVQVYYGYTEQYCVKNCTESSWSPPNDFFWAKCTNSTDLLTPKKSICNQTYVGYDLKMFRPDAIEILYGFDFSTTSNIIFTQGSIDPYASGGLTDEIPGIKNGYLKGIYNFHMKRAAHHLDLRQPNTCDPPQVVNARYQIVRIIQCWLTPSMQHCAKYPYEPDSLPKDYEYNGECQYILYGFPWNQTDTTSSQSNGSSSFFISIFAVLVLYIAAFALNVFSS